LESPRRVYGQYLVGINVYFGPKITGLTTHLQDSLIYGDKPAYPPELPEEGREPVNPYPDGLSLYAGETEPSERSHKLRPAMKRMTE
jgi:hypothetical protein